MSEWATYTTSEKVAVLVLVAVLLWMVLPIGHNPSTCEWLDDEEDDA